MSQEETYTKLSEAIGTEGQDYEVAALTFVYVWCFNHELKFRLATNLQHAVPFDDIVLLLYNRGEDAWSSDDYPRTKSALLLLQMTYKRNYRPTRSDMMGIGPRRSKDKLTVKNCFESYSKMDLNKVKAELGETDKGLNILFGLCTNSSLDGHVLGSSQKIIPNDLFQQLGSSEAFSVDDTDLTAEKDRLDWMKSQKAQKFLQNFRFFHGRSAEDFDEQSAEQLEQLLGPDARPLFSDLKQSIRTWWSCREKNMEFLTWSCGPMGEICGRILRAICDDYLRHCSASWVAFSKECIEKCCKQLKGCVEQMTFFADEGASALTAFKVHQALSALRYPHVIGSVATLKSHQVTVVQLCRWACNWIVVVEEPGQDARPLLDQLLELAEDCSLVVVLVTERRLQGAIVDSCVAADLAPSTLQKLPQIAVRLQGNEYCATLGDLLPDTDSLSEVLEGHGQRLLWLVASAVRHEPLRLGLPIPPVDDWYVRRSLVSNRLLDGESFLRSLGQSDICLTNDSSADQICRILAHCHPIRFQDAAEVAPYTAWPLILIGGNSRAVSDKFFGCNVYELVHTSVGWELLHSSKGISVIRNYLVNEEKLEVGEETHRKILLNFMDIADKVVIIEGKPGVGKSSLLSSIAIEIKEKDPKTWVLRFNLLRYASLLKQSQNSTETVTELVKDALSEAPFTSPEIIQLQSHIELAILEQCLKHTSNVVILVDGFDEISPDYTEKCFAIVQSLISRCRLLCVTTRPTMAKELEDVLGVVAYTLEEYSDQELQTFFLNYKKMGFVKDFLSAAELNEQLRSILRIPLFAKVFADIMSRGKQGHDPVTLFEEFFEMKYQRLFEEKYSANLSVPGATAEMEYNRGVYMNELMQLALISLLNDLSGDPSVPTFRVKLNYFLKPGIVFDFVNGKPVFLHRTFAEFFLAKWCVNNIDSCGTVFRVSFLDYKLEFFVECFSRMACRGKMLHEAVINNNKETVTELLSSADTLQTEADVTGRNALHLAVIHDRWKIARLIAGTGVGLLMVKDRVLRWTPLEYAQAAQRWGIVGILMQAGVTSEDLVQSEVKFNTRDTSQLEHIFRTSGYPALLDAILDGATSATPEAQFKVAVSLITVQFQTSCHSPNGRTLLQCALEHDHREVVRTLVIGGADAMVTDSDGRTALHVAVEKGDAALAALLLEVAAGRDDVDLDWQALLRTAAERQHLRVVERLAAVKLQGPRRSGWTYLHWAAASEDILVLSALLDAGAQVDAQDTEESTALHVAAAYNKVEAVRLLLQHGCNADIEDYRGDTPLAVAAREKHFEIVEAMAAANLRSPRNDDWTCLQWAAACGSTKILRVLASTGGDIFTADVEGCTPLHLAAKNGHEEAVELLLGLGAEARLEDCHGHTALALACMAKHEKVVSCLAEAALRKSLHDGWSYLHLAAESGDTQVLRDLMCGFADPAATDDCGCSPLHTAAAMGQLECAALLVDAGASLEGRNNQGVTPLLMAATHGRDTVLRELLARGADATASDSYGRTALHLAAEGNHAECASALLEVLKGGDRERASQGGATALLAAAAAGNSAVLLELCKGGCNMSARDAEGAPALHIAVAKGHVECAKVLLEEGANAEEKDAAGLTAIVLAAKQCQPEIINELLGCVLAPREQKWSTIHWAAYVGDHKWVESLVAKQGEARAPGGVSALHVAAAVGRPEVVQVLSRDLAVHARDACGWTPLLYAAACSDAGRRRRTVLELLAAGADAGYEAPSGDSALSLAASARRLDVVIDLAKPMLLYEPQDGWTPLHWAIHSRNVKVIRALIAAGHKVSTRDKQGSTALHLAAEEFYVEGARILLEAGAKIEKKDKSGHTALVLAAQRGQGEMMLFLLDAGADPSAVSVLGYKPLHTAVLTGDEKQVKSLLKKGVDINDTTEHDFTPMMIAACIRNLKMLKCLMGHKPDLKKTNFISWTALHYAARNGPPEVVNYLIDQGADVNVRDLNGWKPIHVAARYSDDEVVAALLSGGADRTETLPHVAPPLTLAVVAAQPRSVKWLLAAGAGPTDGCLLALATSDDCNDVDDAARPEVARVLLAAGARADPAAAQEARKRGFTLLAATIEAAAR
ncbi:uncharacterized protein LOC126355974 [Schistocerca gregaria]|uniref:uncharacterized protein LOC126355974 n=1 Tax=Schistocerca gregaria TaxID=7010 RepID=UPI00211E6CA6|nr:uncharacterized protein LOC126355974 [Schistocerca gregaria]